MGRGKPYGKPVPVQNFESPEKPAPAFRLPDLSLMHWGREAVVLGGVQECPAIEAAFAGNGLQGIGVGDIVVLGPDAVEDAVDQ